MIPLRGAHAADTGEVALGAACADMEEDRVDDEKAVLLKRGRWGVFRITPRPDLGEFGAYQASCPFHARSEKTGCKKHISILGPTPKDSKLALRRACLWCAKAPSFSRQRLGSATGSNQTSAAAGLDV